MSNSIESQGVATVSDTERTAKPTSIITIFVGSNLSLSVMVFGWLSILYGLSWWQSVSAILAGTLIASIGVSFSSLLGWRGATNNSVASGAFFGVKGRLIASFVGLLLCIQYVALTVWTGGETISAGWARLTDSKESDITVALGYAAIALAIFFFAILGYRAIIRLNRWIGPIMIILVLLSIVGLRSEFDSSYPGDPSAYALGTLQATWLLAALTAGAAGPISFVTQTGDWSRYISDKAYSARQVAFNTFIAMFVGLSLPTLFGAFVATAAFNEDSFASGYVAGVPTWLLIPLLLVGFVGSLGQGSINLYSMGLDMDAILPRLSRVRSTALVAAIATALVFIGKFLYGAEAAVTNSVLLLTCLATSWFAITLYGYLSVGGVLDKSALQAFNDRTTGGIYWFSRGWNLQAVAAWIFGSVVGILSISSVDYIGPIATLLGDIDASIPASALSALAAYVGLRRLIR